MVSFYVYMMSNKVHVLYVGVTNDLLRRVGEHCGGEGGRFTSRYGLTRLVYFEQWLDITQAILREKELKGWRREKKVRLVQSVNPDWRDLKYQL